MATEVDSTTELEEPAVPVVDVVVPVDDVDARQDMLELGLIGIEDIRTALAADKQARATIYAEKSGPCSCRGEPNDCALYECKSCLLDALSSPISDDEIRYNEVCIPYAIARN